jgi:CRISPR/Cas system-associated protein Cas10 (large subunit of type III CRISPR-Cas system)
MSSEFFEKYKDPRWQKKRLEIMEASDFMCEMCGDGSETLSVHHKYYIQGNDPWDYSNDALVTLCNTCHKNEHVSKDHFEVFLREMKERFTFYQLSRIFDGILYELTEADQDEYMFDIADSMVCATTSGRLLPFGEYLEFNRIMDEKENKIQEKLNESL